MSKEVDDLYTEITNGYREIARGNIEQHLGDCFDPDHDASSDAIYDEAYTLAFDAMVDAGCPHEKARAIAQEIAQCYAQP